MNNQQEASSINEKARRAQEDGRLDEAIALYLEAAKLDPAWSIPCYNLGLVYKMQQQWEKSIEYNWHATELDPEHDAAWWNLGIAATAAGNWDLARSAWRGFGVDVPDGDGPVDLPCGYSPIRLNPHGAAEVVWAKRIDPARAVLVSIPFPESNHRWSDLVLNDGAPMGYRQYRGKDVPVFDELQLLEASPFGTFVARVRVIDREEHLAAGLPKLAEEQGGAAEDWSTSIQILCKACSEGRVHEEHDTINKPKDGKHIIGIAAKSREHATEILHAWESQSEDIRVESLEDALAPVGNE